MESKLIQFMTQHNISKFIQKRILKQLGEELRAWNPLFSPNKTELHMNYIDDPDWGTYLIIYLGNMDFQFDYTNGDCIGSGGSL